MEKNGKKTQNAATESSAADILSVTEISALLKIPASSIYRLAQQGKIRGVKFGRHWRFLAKDIHDYLHGSRSIAKPVGPSNQRLFRRIKSEIPARLEGSLSGTKNIRLKGAIEDISEGGIYFSSTNLHLKDGPSLKVGHPVRIVFEFDEPTQSKMEIKGCIIREAHNYRTGFGIKFRHLSQENQEMIHDYVG